MIDGPNRTGPLPVQGLDHLTMIRLELLPIPTQQVGQDAPWRLGAVCLQGRQAQPRARFFQDRRDHGALLM